MVNENRNVIYVNGSLSSSSTLFPCLQCKVISQPSAYEEEKFSRYVLKRFDAFDRFQYWELPHVLLIVQLQYLWNKIKRLSVCQPISRFICSIAPPFYCIRVNLFSISIFGHWQCNQSTIVLIALIIFISCHAFAEFTLFFFYVK